MDDERSGSEALDAEALDAEALDAEALDAEALDADVLGADMLGADMLGADMLGADVIARLRALPRVDDVLARDEMRALASAHGRPAVLRAVRTALDQARAAIRRGDEAGDLPARIEALVLQDARGSLVPVLNATGVVLHTNLGRAPLSDAALASVVEIARGYSTLEYDLEAGARGSRHGHAIALLRELTGAEDALVVNNNAGAVLLMLAALCAGREVVVSRGELVEIGGGFRVPDVMAASGAKLVEVGTTNRTHPRDYEAAIAEATAALLKVHRSNFEIVGFTAEVCVARLAEIARGRGVPLLVDAGSGCLGALPAAGGPLGSASVREEIAAGADVVCFSGDKLLGGPQAGIAVGRGLLIEKMRRHPLMRALRPDKLALAALVATLRAWRDEPARLPVVRMLTAPEEGIAARAEAVAARLEDAPGLAAPPVVVPTRSKVGGGASPLVELPSAAVRLTVRVGADALAQALRETTPPVIARVEDGAVLLDLRSVPPDEDARLTQSVTEALEEIARG